MTKKFNFLAARSQQQDIHKKQPQLRRAGIGKTIAEVQLQPQDLPENEVNARAKAQRSTKKGPRHG